MSVPAPSHGVLRTLVTGMVDYAGLFPPASLTMDVAVANFAAYRMSADAWMLGRFVVPVSRLDEWEAATAALEPALHAGWQGARISALLSGEFARECELVQDLNARAPFGTVVDALEGRAVTPDAVLAMAAAIPDDVHLYCELPHREDPLAFVAAVKASGVRAKLRTGGVTPDAFPTPTEVVRFLRRCHDAGVTAKATAGLHHPLRGDYRLTYAPDALTGTMYGYLNLLLCAAAIRAGADDDSAVAILTLADTSGIVVSDVAIVVCGVTLSAIAIAAMRSEGVVAFGSCSFREPVDELGVLLSV